MEMPLENIVIQSIGLQRMTRLRHSMQSYIQQMNKLIITEKDDMLYL